MPMFTQSTRIWQLKEVDGPLSPLFPFWISSNHLVHALAQGFRVNIAGKNPMKNVNKGKAATPGDSEDFASGCMLKLHGLTPNHPQVFSRREQNPPDHLFFVFVFYPFIHQSSNLSIHLHPIINLLTSGSIPTW